jgi:hypothetical protein
MPIFCNPSYRPLGAEKQPETNDHNSCPEKIPKIGLSVVVLAPVVHHTLFSGKTVRPKELDAIVPPGGSLKKRSPYPEEGGGFEKKMGHF